MGLSEEQIEKMYEEFELLKGEFDVVKRILDIYYEPLKTTDAALELMYKNAKRHDSQDLSSWCSTMLGLRLEHLKVMAKLTGDNHPWRVFFGLCDAFEKQSGKEYWETELLNAAHSHMIRLSNIWITLVETTKPLLKAIPTNTIAMSVVERVIKKTEK